VIEIFLIALMRLLTGAVLQSRGFTFDPSRQRIYYANHSSHLDTLLIWGLIPKTQRKKVRPAAAKDYWWSSSWRRYLAEKVFHAIPVVRHRESAEENPLQLLAAALAEGDSLIFFPEGTRTVDGKIQPFKSGLYHLVSKCPGAALVPVYIDKLSRVLPKGEILPVPIIVTVTFGEEFYLREGEDKAKFIMRAQTLLADLAPR
jgi:1-acyl-sn-glycerol-3-phosphate acyltransferase